MTRESWKAVAMALGDAMQNHQYCDTHMLTDPEPSCPFCADRAVYLRFRKYAEKNGARFRDPIAGAKSVSLFELRSHRD